MIGVVRSMFRWAVSEELINPAILDAIRTVEGLHSRDGRTRETASHEAPPSEHVDAVEGHIGQPMSICPDYTASDDKNSRSSGVAACSSLLSPLIIARNTGTNRIGIS